MCALGGERNDSSFGNAEYKSLKGTSLSWLTKEEIKVAQSSAITKDVRMKAGFENGWE